MRKLTNDMIKRIRKVHPNNKECIVCRKKYYDGIAFNEFTYMYVNGWDPMICCKKCYQEQLKEDLEYPI